MKKVLVLLLLLVFCVPAQAEVVHTYASPTLRYAIESVVVGDANCYVTHVWMADPGRQIRKATAQWEVDLAWPMDMAESVPGAMLAVNGSGYVSPVFPEIPENYPGGSPDYYYTPLGSLTITDGKVFRNLEGVPFYGLTLQADGLHMHVGEDNQAILEDQPTQTWSFYEGCPMVADHKSILDHEWRFAQASAMRTIIAKLEDGTYLLFTVTNKPFRGLSLIQCVEYLQTNYDPLWIYDLDGGPSSALMYRESPDAPLTLLWGGKSRDADIMAFTE